MPGPEQRRAIGCGHRAEPWIRDKAPALAAVPVRGAHRAAAVRGGCRAEGGALRSVPCCPLRLLMSRGRAYRVARCLVPRARCWILDCCEMCCVYAALTRLYTPSEPGWGGSPERNPQRLHAVDVPVPAAASVGKRGRKCPQEDRLGTVTICDGVLLHPVRRLRCTRLLTVGSPLFGDRRYKLQYVQPILCGADDTLFLNRISTALFRCNAACVPVCGTRFSVP